MRASGALSTRQKWMDLVRQQEQSGVLVKIFCRDRGVSEPSFHSWRKRLAATDPVRFALIDSGATGTKENAPMELILASGDWLMIAGGVDATTLRTVLNVLRERA